MTDVIDPKNPPKGAIEVLGPEKATAVTGPSARILQVFFDTSMRAAHKGLAQIASDNGIDVRKLEKGQFLIYVNPNRTAIKLYAPGNVVAHYVHPQGHRIDTRALRYIPDAFNFTGKISYNLALQKVVEEKMKPHGNMKEERERRKASKPEEPKE